MLRWNSETVTVAGLEAGVVGLCPGSAHDQPRWYLATRDGWLRGIDFDDGSRFFEMKLPFTFPVTSARTEHDGAELAASADGRFVAVMSRYGVQGALYDTHEGRLLRTFERGGYHANVSSWAVAIVRWRSNDVLICAADWNRLEAFELPSLRPLVPSVEASLDYFYGALTASPSGKSLASFGWVWQPVGLVRTIDVDAWLSTGADPPPGAADVVLADWWDDAMCWVSETELAVVGDEPRDDDDSFFSRREGVVIVEASTQKQTRIIRGVDASAFGCDGQWLYALGASTQVISLQSGAVIASLKRPSDAWHPGARVVLTCPPLRLESGPCTLSWLSGAAGDLSLPVAPPTPESLQVLADALDERGADPSLIAHCRAQQPHGKRCWAIEALTTRAADPATG